MTIDQAYQKANAVKPEGPVLPLTFLEAQKAVRKMYRHLTGMKFPLPIVETSGNRYTWSHSGTFRVNCDKGWDDLIHLFSHWFYERRVGGRPHSKSHARLEKNLRKWAIERGWMSGSLKKEEMELPPHEIKNQRIQDRAMKARKNMEKWERKVKHAKTMLKKWTAKVKYYDKKTMVTGN